MSKVKVLFFAADPLSIASDGSTPRLLLDEEVRRIRKRVHTALFGSMLEFDWRLAGRTQDLQQAIEETRPRIVHFSGHGGRKGLVLLGADGRTPRPVDTPVLRELFEKDPGVIQVVVLTACYSRPQAEAIKEVVGCAIGTRDRISDEASIIFSAKFYSAIASGRSVQDAFERARLALRLEHPDEGDILEILHRDDVNPAKIVLVSRFRRLARAAAGIAAIALSAAVATEVLNPPPPVEPPASHAVRLGDCTSGGSAVPALSSPLSAAASANPGSPSEAATSLDQAKAFCRAGSYDSAFVYFKRSAEEGEREAMSFLAIAYLSGEGTARDSTLGMHWLEQGGKERRDPRGMNTLAIIYENDARMAGRYYWARHWYTEAAEQGYAEAMRNLGRHYRVGLGVARSDSLALHWYQKAADAGSPDAMVDIGRMHEQGLNGRRDAREALRLYSGAARAGSPMGMYAMGRVYQEGALLGRDYVQARSWYFKGACAGSAEAMNNLALMYEEGLGVAVDRGEAIGWFRRAADAGSTRAAANLARLGADRQKSRPKALAWIGPPEPRLPPGCTTHPVTDERAGAAVQRVVRLVALWVAEGGSGL
ncbi:MAG TPA: CHAT domain-containing protein [Longimicrobium sp.]|jgi:TPR repeat protein|uniref:CHAT domain-containing protein n=1 Tax=Longimicrobium sp. TaxID=2029185 RepID=UPI002EDB1940